MEGKVQSCPNGNRNIRSCNPKTEVSVQKSASAPVGPSAPGTAKIEHPNSEDSGRAPKFKQHNNTIPQLFELGTLNVT